MAAWLVTALRLVGLLGAGAGIGQVVAGGGSILPIGPPGGLIPGFPDPLDLFARDPVKKRRRRRRALTASDRADIGFIVGLLGPAAGKQFAVTLAARGR